ncbi:hypothetical protein [Natrinema sp. CGMCC1.2065]|uniref:hypothetical protein n=1 Tax=Natrinema sp. CGMCC1.2065 TaxID=3445767 RepID=UPI003F49E978
MEDADSAGELGFHSSVTSGNGDRLEPDSSVDVEVVHPDAPVESDADAELVALTVEAQEKRFHIASDARDPSNVKADGDVDVLTLQHHGAAPTTEWPNMNSPSWISGMGPPEHVVVPANYSKQHPTSEAVANVDEVSDTPNFYITSEHESGGAVTFVVQDEDLSVEYDDGKSTDPGDWVEGAGGVPRLRPPAQSVSAAAAGPLLAG